jgi:hypothetical protein
VLLDEPGGTYWRDWQAFVQRHLLDTAFISPADFSLYKVLHSVDETVSELLTFYRVFHSMRYVKQYLAIRLADELHPNVLSELGRQFGDIVASGEFHQRPALSDEADEPHLAHLPRLVFHFNRRSLGRLRELIDFINQGSDAPRQAPQPPLNGRP